MRGCRFWHYHLLFGHYASAMGHGFRIAGCAPPLFFGFVCLLSASLSSAPNYSLGEAISWFRFPLFAMATAFWLGRDKRLLYAMLLSTGIGMMLMTGILTAEMLIEGQKHGRLTWPYGDLVPGNYLAKAGLPAFCVMVALAVGGKGKTAFVMGALASFSLALSVLAGERINLVIRICSGVLAFVSWRIKWQNSLNSHPHFFCFNTIYFYFPGGMDPRFTTLFSGFTDWRGAVIIT